MALMEPDANFEQYGVALVEAFEAVAEEWVVRSVVQRVRDFTGADPSRDVMAAARAAGQRAREEVGGAMRDLVALDVDDQRVNPLALMRGGVRYATAVLRAAGVPPVVREEFAERAFPDDIYGLSPASFADVDVTLHEPGLLWGAAKAHAHLSRRRLR